MVFDFHSVRGILALVFGAVGIVFNVLVYQQPTGMRLRLMKLASDVMWMMQYIMLGAYTGAAISVIALCRELVFISQYKWEWAKSRVFLYIFIAAGLFSPVYTWSGWYSLLPVVCSVVSVIGFWIAKPTLSRVLSFPVCLSMLIYDLVCTPVSVMGAVNESMTFVTSLTRWIVSDYLPVRRAKKAALPQEAADDTAR